MPFCRYCCSKRDLPMPLAFLGALLLLLFLFPQWRQAVGRRPEAGQHISVSSGLHSPSHPLSLFISGKLTKGGPTIHLTAEPSHFFRGGGGRLTFSFSSSARTFSSSSSPWAGGRGRRQRRGCKQRQSRGDTSVFRLLTG